MQMYPCQFQSSTYVAETLPTCTFKAAQKFGSTLLIDMAVNSKLAMIRQVNSGILFNQGLRDHMMVDQCCRLLISPNSFVRIPGTCT